MHTTRTLVRLGLAAAFALALGCGPQGGEPASADAPASSSSSSSAPSRPAGSGIASLDDAEAMRIYYQFVDERGRVRFVPTLAEVPPDWRARVGFVEMSSPPPGTPADAKRLRDKRTAHLALPARGATPSGDADESGGGGGKEVILYGADWCGACRAAKRYMDDKGIDYDERNVDEKRWADEMNAKAGRGGIPVFDVEGQILRGFSPERLDELLS